MAMTTSYQLNSQGQFTEESPRIDQPAKIRTTLFSHQKTLIHAATQLEATHRVVSAERSIHTNVGVIADQVGSGKTMEVLGLIANSPSPGQCVPAISSHSDFFHSYVTPTPPSDNSDSDSGTAGGMPSSPYTNENLIIVPHPLASQWEDALSEFDTDWYVIKSRKTLKAYVHTTRYTVVVLSNTFIKQYLAACETLSASYSALQSWRRVIIDEPQLCQLSPIADLFDYAGFVWCVCATPSVLFHSQKYCFKKLFGHPGTHLSRELCLRNSPEYIRQSIVLPAVVYRDVLCKTPYMLRCVGHELPPNVLDLLQAGCAAEALALLNCKTHTHDNVVQAVTEFYNTKLHNLEQSIACVNGLILGDAEKAKRLKPKYEQAAALKAKIRGIEERINEMATTICPICVETFERPLITACCQNIFCLECITKCYNSNAKCPLCRAALDLSRAYAIVDEPAEPTPEAPVPSPPQLPLPPKLLSKDQTLVSILQNLEPTQKVLLYSNYGQSFLNLKALLHTEQLGYEMLVGTGASIHSKIQRFREGATQLLLLTSANFGTGLNLEMATDIIIYHHLGVDLEKQVIGRAQRCGRTAPLTVTYLKYETED
jgi:SNF2 family DNA or RNA helicase